MVTQITCPHCRETVDLVDESTTSCPLCSGKLSATPPANPTGGDIDSPLTSTRVLGAGLAPVKSTYNLDRSPAAEASFGGKAVENTLYDAKTDKHLKRQPRGVTTRGVDDPQTVERQAAKTQARQRLQVRMRRRLVIVIVTAVILAGAIAAAAMLYLHHG